MYVKGTYVLYNTVSIAIHNSVSCQLWAHLLWAPEYTYLVLGRKRCFAPKTDVCLCNADHAHLANCIRLLNCYFYRYMYNDNTSMFVSRLNPVA